MQPEYTVTVQEAHSHLKPRQDGWGKFRRIFRIVMFALVGVMVAASVILRENLLAQFSLAGKVAFIGAFVFSLGGGKKLEDVLCPVQFRFYSDRLELYRSEMVYSDGKRTREISVLPYHRIRECRLDTRNGRLTITGESRRIQFRYDAQGNLPQTPDYDHTHAEFNEILSLRNEHTVDIVREIENHSPIKVRIITPGG